MADKTHGRQDIFEDLKTMLEYYQTLGISRLPVSLKEPQAASKVPSLHAGKKEPGAAKPARQQEDKSLLLEKLREEIGDCVRCKLSKQRKNIVFGEGDPDARLMFIGEAPGRDEDIQGMPFVGEAGMLLTKLIEKMGLKRSSVYIGNIIKCRPPMNRDPEEDEVLTCRPFIERQIEIIGPEVIMTLGRIALQTLMNDPKIKITAARGRSFEFRDIPVIPTFHPAYLLRNPADKWKTWADAQKVLQRLHRE